MATVGELIEYVRRRTNDAAFPRDAAMQADIIRRALKTLSRQHDWSFYSVREERNCVGPKSAGTVALQAGSASVTGTGTSFQTTDIGAFLILDNESVAYEIAACASTTGITLASQYVPTDVNYIDGTAVDYRIVYPDVALTYPVARIVGVTNRSQIPEMRWVPRADLELRLRNTNAYGTPLLWCGIPSEATQKVRMFPPPDKNYPLLVHYYRIPASPSATPGDSVDWDGRDDLLEAACFYEACRTGGMGSAVTSMYGMAKSEFFDQLATAKDQDAAVDGPILIGERTRAVDFRVNTIRYVVPS